MTSIGRGASDVRLGFCFNNSTTPASPLLSPRPAPTAPPEQSARCGGPLKRLHLRTSSPLAPHLTCSQSPGFKLCGALDEARLPHQRAQHLTVTTPHFSATLIMSGAATPRAPVSARASVPPTGAATPALQLHTSSASPGLPTPTTFDILPDLHKLLKRLLDTAPAPVPSQSASDGPLEIQHVATAASDVRLKLQRAQRAVMALPEIDRTCEDQEEEIEDLEARIARLKASLRELGRPTETAEDADQRMTG